MPRGGFEPPTRGFSIRCSTKLSYLGTFAAGPRLAEQVRPAVLVDHRESVGLYHEVSRPVQRLGRDILMAAAQAAAVPARGSETRCFFRL